jgi:hypothetical protein
MKKNKIPALSVLISISNLLYIMAGFGFGLMWIISYEIYKIIIGIIIILGGISFLYGTTRMSMLLTTEIKKEQTKKLFEEIGGIKK